MLPSKKAGKSIRSSNVEISSSVEGEIVRMIDALCNRFRHRPASQGVNCYAAPGLSAAEVCDVEIA